MTNTKSVNPFPNAFLALLAICAFVLFSCKKQQSFDAIPAINQDSLNAAGIKSYYITEEKVQLLPSDKNGNVLSEEALRTIRNNNGQKRTGALCDGFFIDESSYQATFRGHFAEIICPTNPSTNMIGLTVQFKIEVPANLVSAGSVGTVQLPAGTWPNSPSARTATATPTFELIYRDYDASLGSHVNVYDVAFTIYMTYDDFCSFQTYRAKVKLRTDCSEIEYFTTSYSSFLNLTPDGYQSYPYYANGGEGDKGKFITAIPLIPTCGQHCHFPSKGSSTTHVFEYRLSGTTNWTSNEIAGLDNNDIPVNDAGTYEYRSRGLIYKNPDIYSPYTSIGTVTVP